MTGILRNLKKLSAWFICTSMCLSFIVTTVNAAEGKYAKEIELLQLFGVADASLDADAFTYDKTVNRAEFAQYMVKLMNIDCTGNAALYYTDIPKTHYAYQEITALTNMGYLTGCGEKTFNPEAAMQSEHAIGVMLKALGCGAILEKSDISTSTLYQLASGMDLLDGVSLAGDLEYGAMFRLFCNALFAECYGLNITDAPSIEKSGDTLLYVTRHMKYVKSGLVTAAGGADIQGGNVRSDVVIIDGVEYEISKIIDTEQYLGRYVEYIYTDNDTDDPVIEWMYVTGRNKELVIEVTPECRYDANTGKLTYTLDGKKEKTVSIPAGITLIYNGAYQKSGINEILGHDRYQLTLIQNDASQYSLAIIREYTAIVVDKKSSMDRMVYGKNDGEQLSLEPDDYETLKILHSDGAVAAYDDITEGKTLCIYQSADKRIMQVYVLEKKIAGMVNSVFTDTNEIKIDQTVYEFYKAGVELSAYQGKNITAYLDKNGYIVYCEIDNSGNVMVGYMFKCRYIEEDEAVMVRIFNEDGKVYRYMSAEKVKYNGKTYKTADQLFNAMSNGSDTVKTQLVAYKVNADKKLIQLDTAHEDDGKSHPLTVNMRAKALNPGEAEAWYCYYSPTAHKLGRTMGIDPDKTVIFRIPGKADMAAADDDDFSVGSLASGLYPSAVSYRTTSEGGYYEQYVVVEVSGTGDDMSDYGMMFDEQYVALNEDDEAVEIVRFADSAGNFKEVEVDKNKLDISKYNLKRGDIFKCALNGLSGKMTAIELVYQPESNTRNEDGAMTAEIRNFGGYVHEASEKGMKLGYTSGADFDEIITAALPVVLYDKQANKIMKATYSDLRTYKTDRSECSFVIVGTNYVNPLVVYAHR